MYLLQVAIIRIEPRQLARQPWSMVIGVARCSPFTTMGRYGALKVALCFVDAAFHTTTKSPQLEFEQPSGPSQLGAIQILVKVHWHVLFAIYPAPASEESAVSDFMVQLFHTLHYTSGHCLSQTYSDFQLFICGKWKQAKINVCLLDCHPLPNIMLLVQADKHFRDGRKCQ